MHSSISHAILTILHVLGEGDEEEGGDDEWHRGRHGDRDGPWDDIDDMQGAHRVGVSGGLDLADLAAASLKFRSDTRGLEVDALGTGHRATPEDEMEKLFREQEDSLVPDNIEEDDEEPEWADAYITEGGSVQHSQPAASEASLSKRSLLFEARPLFSSATHRISVSLMTFNLSVHLLRS